MSQDPPRTIVIGAGPAGLAAGNALARAELPVTVLEARSTPGGWCRTIEHEGYRFEVGPQTWRAPAGGAIDQLVQWAGLEGEVRPPSEHAKKRFVLRGDRLYAVPRALPRLIGVGGVARAMSERWRGAKVRPRESVAGFVRRRFGPALAPLCDAFVSGVFAGDPDRLELASAFPALARAEADHGSVLRALGSFPKREIAGLEGGLGQLTEALAVDLGPALRCGEPAIGLLPASDSLPWQVVSGRASYEAERLLLSLPAFAAADLLRPHDPELATLLAGIPYAPVAVVSLGYDASAFAGGPPEGFGFLAPRSAGRRLLGCIYASSLFPEAAPPGKVALRVLLGGARDPGAVELSEERLLAIVERELRDVLGLRASPEVHHVLRLERAIPQYERGHGERVGAIEARAAKYPGLSLIGNAYRGVSLSDTLTDALAHALP